MRNCGTGVFKVHPSRFVCILQENRLEIVANFRLVRRRQCDQPEFVVRKQQQRNGRLLNGLLTLARERSDDPQRAIKAPVCFLRFEGDVLCVVSPVFSETPSG